MEAIDHITWILVADASKARIFKTHKAKLFNENANGASLTLVSEHAHDESRKRDNELVSDRYGKFVSGTFVEPTDPKKHEEEKFAVELAKILTQAHHKNDFRDVIFIAPPTFMGMIHKHLPDTVSRTVSLTIEKDYTSNNERELVKKLREYL